MDKAELVKELKRHHVRFVWGKGPHPIQYTNGNRVTPPELIEAANELTREEWTKHQIVYRYDLRDAEGLGHPQEVMKRLGVQVVDAQPESIGDCWFFEVLDEIVPLPKYLSPSKYKFDP